LKTDKLLFKLKEEEIAEKKLVLKETTNAELERLELDRLKLEKEKELLAKEKSTLEQDELLFKLKEEEIAEKEKLVLEERLEQIKKHNSSAEIYKKSKIEDIQIVLAHSITKAILLQKNQDYNENLRILLTNSNDFYKKIKSADCEPLINLYDNFFSFFSNLNNEDPFKLN